MSALLPRPLWLMAASLPWPRAPRVPSANSFEKFHWLCPCFCRDTHRGGQLIDDMAIRWVHDDPRRGRQIGVVASQQSPSIVQVEHEVSRKLLWVQLDIAVVDGVASLPLVGSVFGWPIGRKGLLGQQFEQSLRNLVLSPPRRQIFHGWSPPGLFEPGRSRPEKSPKVYRECCMRGHIQKRGSRSSPNCSAPVFIRRSCPNALGTRRWRSRCSAMRMPSPTCSRMPPIKRRSLSGTF